MSVSASSLASAGGIVSAGSPLAVPLAAIGGWLGGKIFGKKKKTNPLKSAAAWYSSNPNLTMEALNRNMNPVTYRLYKPVFDLVDEYKSEWEKTNQANELRYRQGLGELQRLQAAARTWRPPRRRPDTFEYGKGQKAAIEQQRRRGVAEGMQNLVSSGLYNTTLAPSLQAAYRDQAARQLMDVEDRIAQYRTARADQDYDVTLQAARDRLANEMNLGGARLDWISGKVDQGPDPNLFSSMLSMYSRTPQLFAPLPEPMQRFAKYWAQRSLPRQ